MTHLNFLQPTLWELWRDMTWARKDRLDYLAKMERYHVRNPRYAESRVRDVLTGSPTDWDDNVPERWAKTLARRWGMRR